MTEVKFYQNIAEKNLLEFCFLPTWSSLRQCYIVKSKEL